MFEPRYTVTPRLLANIKRIAELTTVLNARSFPKIVLMEFVKRANSLSAYASTSIEGNPLPITDVKRILKSHPDHARDSEREVLNYNDALMYLNECIDRGQIVLDEKLVLSIHNMVMEGLISKGRLGKLRVEPVIVNDPRSGKIAYLPPDAKDVVPLMNDLIGFIRKQREALDPLIIAGIFHKQFVVIHPFMDGNGRAVRLLTKALLADMGLNTFNLFSFENYYNRNVSAYFQQVGVYGNYYELLDDIDFTEWLEYFTDGIIDELLRVDKELGRAIVSPQDVLKLHHRKMLGYIKRHGFITDSAYAKLVSRAKATRSLDFKKLAEMNLIERHGKGKNTHYKLK